MDPDKMRFSQPRSRLLRRPNRLIICLVGLVLLVWTYREHSWSQSVQTPILGANLSELSLYFPPVGQNFHPTVPKYNVYNHDHPRTPLLIPFTRNNTMLKQAVLSYIAGGWPRNDIVVIDNTGVMDSNIRGRLSEDNPFFLDYNLFRGRYGVAILQTPTLLNFAQLQNFFLRVAVTRNWPFYFWSHMDIAVLSGEDIQPYKSFYHRIIDVLDSSGIDQWSTVPPGRIVDEAGPAGPAPLFQMGKTHPLGIQRRGEKLQPKWAVKFFDFDNLALINVDAWKKIGQWDVFIPYYNTDCDAYGRVLLNGFTKEEAQAGYIFDIAGVIDDPEKRFFPAESADDRKRWGLAPDGPEPKGGEVNSLRFQWLKSDLQELMDSKNSNELGRNTWQGSASKATDRKQPEQWSHDPKAFQAAWWAMADYGRAMYVKKWGTLECKLDEVNKTLNDSWLQEYLVEGSPEWVERVKDEDHWNGVLGESAIR